MDQILLLGFDDQKFADFLRKVGNRIVQPTEQNSLAHIAAGEVIDLVIIDTRHEPDPLALVQFVRGQEKNRAVPVLVIADHRVHRLKFRDAGVDDCEFLDGSYSIGQLASRAATLLRLRKIAGRDDGVASLAEVNAALRDLNEKFAKELEEARAIQQNLLPRTLPKDPRFELAASYQPLEEVGGDWYYVRKMNSGRISLLIGDVTGHGLSAAFIGSMAKLAFFAADEEMPHELLASMNRLMTPHLPEGRFVTMFSCLYDPETGELHFARAGHVPGFLLRAETNQVEQLLGEGFPLGFFPDSEFSNEQRFLAAGDTLVLLTDAIPETQNMAGEQFGFDRLAEVMCAGSSGDGAVEILTRIIERFEAFREGRLLKDDVTLLALRRSPGEPGVTNDRDERHDTD